jgi:hypothetical protein
VLERSESLHEIVNEYGVSSIDYWSRPKPAILKHFEKNHNITMEMPDGSSIHPVCLNCQINQILKYPESNDYSVRHKGVSLYDDPNGASDTTAQLRKGSTCTMLRRNDDWCKVRATTLEARCIENPDDHPIIYSDEREILSESLCKCGSRMRVVEEENEGWVLWDNLTFFKCPCEFIPEKKTLPKRLQKLLSKDDQDRARLLIDPVAWVENHLGMKPRDNQRLNLMCTCKNMVLREGRRSGKTWGECMFVLNYVLTNEFYDGKDALGNDVYRGPKVVVATPYLSQIELIFGILDSMLHRNPDLLASRVRYVKTPFHVMKFSNGAEIQGFTTGTQSKQEAGTVRGQAADMILLDEVDIMDSNDITRSIRPIQITSPHVRLMVSSTPTGKREWFYNICENAPRFKEFYFPSTIIPHWDQVKEEAEAEGTHEYFLQEYMAVFTVQITGVYQPTYIAMAETPYVCGQSEPYIGANGEVPIHIRCEDWIYTMGVDWNTNAGTEILVLGFDRDTLNQWVVETKNIPKQDWQQLAAMEQIIELNSKWLPKYIYMDRGYGATQIEALQRYAMEKRAINPSSPDAKMVENLHAYDFGSKVEYRDPMTGEVKKTHAKAFLIEHSVRQFESARIHYPAKDPFLTKQLLNYIISGFTATGVPKYGMNSEKVGDHRLDALNLAMIPFKLHMTDFAMDGPTVTSVAMMGGFGSGNIRQTVHEDGGTYEEFMANLPRDQHGAPAIGGLALRVRHEPGYVEMKNAERYNELDFSRTSGLSASQSKEAPVLRLGFSSDTDYKYNKAPGATVVKRSHSKPGRRKF